MFLGKTDQRRPDFQEPRPVLGHALSRIAAHERIDHSHAQQFGGHDDSLEVLDIDLGLGLIGRQRIGVVSQSGDGHAGQSHELTNFAGLFRAEVAGVHVRHARVTPLGLAPRPAHQLDARKALGRCEPHDLVQAEVRQNGTHETQLHGVVLSM